MTEIDITLVQTITNLDKYSLQVIRRYSTCIMPQVGHKVRDDAFKDTFPSIETIIIDFHNDECILNLPLISTNGNSKEEVNNLIEDFVRKGWEETIHAYPI